MNKKYIQIDENKKTIILYLRNNGYFRFEINKYNIEQGIDNTEGYIINHNGLRFSKACYFATLDEAIEEVMYLCKMGRTLQPNLYLEFVKEMKMR
jgi:hypothetical protein